MKRFDPIVLYSHSYAHAEAGMDEWEHGDYVLYSEHVAEIEKYKLLAKAAWEVGHATAKAVYDRSDDEPI